MDSAPIDIIGLFRDGSDSAVLHAFYCDSKHSDNDGMALDKGTVAKIAAKAKMVHDGLTRNLQAPEFNYRLPAEYRTSIVTRKLPPTEASRDVTILTKDNFDFPPWTEVLFRNYDDPALAPPTTVTETSGPAPPK